ncbi:MAG: aldehyde dehydrogenase [Myxococcales bacterium]|nr:aldehyde dehydrogenase [Myxococcales bacterium]
MVTPPASSRPRHDAAPIPPTASAVPTERAALDEALAILRARARPFARLAPAAKAALVRACMPRIADCAEAWVATGCKAKRLTGPWQAEEWIAGPLPTLRLARLLGDSLEAIARRGRPPLGSGGCTRADGRVEIDAFPVSNLDRVAFLGFRGSVLLEAGLTRDEAARRQASFYRQRDPEGGVALVLGAGNVSSIPPMDVLSKMFVEGFVCLLKMNPVNEWAGPILERALAPLCDAGYLRIVYGGGDVGAYLVAHEHVDDVHITGSDQTHDRIVWGPPGPDRERRRASGEPLLAKPISSELGNVSPVMIVPADYHDGELAFMAANLATMVTNNASFNCNAAKVVVTGRGWAQHDAFWGLVARALVDTPARAAYYPGAVERYARLTAGRDLHVPGGAGAGELPWTIIRGVDVAAADPVFTVEPFCAVVSDVVLPAADPVEFLAEATRFCNDRLWGTLNAAVMIDPRTARDPAMALALERAIVDLRYGTVAINHWPALGYGVGSLPWGGHPSANLRDIQSGLGWVHNTYMLEGVDKAILRGPLVVRPRPLWFTGNPRAVEVARRMIRHELAPSWLGLARVVGAALA